ncbi:MAG: hypothetical protein DHS20C14_22910 [Phycisphaeraceae bacterium]|nr:MAG: hypothetical protein DHS20C14_22910 [Phycisphaeraceae bacterium]
MAKRTPRPASPERPGGRARLTEHCRTLVGTTEDVKWGAALVFSVVTKMYVMFDLEDQRQFSFQCDEDDFDRLTEMEGIIPAPYAARMGWVKVLPDAKITMPELRRLLTKAHGLIAQKLPKKTQRELGLL